MQMCDYEIECSTTLTSTYTPGPQINLWPLGPIDNESGDLHMVQVIIEWSSSAPTVDSTVVESVPTLHVVGSSYWEVSQSVWHL